MRPNVELGLGLLSIGRNWGVHNSQPPLQHVAMQLLQDAHTLGIRCFDTAPAYGDSERLLGQFLANLTIEERAQLVISTKMGEFWAGEGNSTRVCHDADELCRSIDQSLRLLGRIDILQIHKASAETLRSPGIVTAITHARNNGITSFGASVSDIPSARLAMEIGLFDWLQFPFSATNSQFSEIFEELADASIRALINRPLAMGQLAAGSQITAAFSFILSSNLPAGSVILTGTGSPLHLRENFKAFAGARR
ncbi:aldo/keto reductase [Roseinatronobacter alkalisoli]|uniref:Aldo/keto reductase n=1 Tax=Roseinatronobacter alkalisoli TaxID=3028235 RepID=A0ABT5TA20_9RHOB|nr:aldo/keto reductase [Roseinatronobacter sp. HJB301]MDD7971965.1 aldo/keto reductase [Roseinatronobacter sp. HJB301]